jgi:aerobic-type carbon monoxide dehydrogenase small subunit (CoxS/CutS family)
MHLIVNQQEHCVPDHFQDELLVWTLRDGLGLRGTRFSCGVGVCGACSVLVDGTPALTCQIETAALVGSNILTLEALGLTNTTPVVAAVRAGFEAFPLQCMWCVSGHVMAAISLLEQHPRPTDIQVEAAMAGNLCRCGGYNHIRKAIAHASVLLEDSASREGPRP